MGTDRSFSIIITGPTFITPKHVQRLKDAGIESERLSALAASESELCDAVQGKDGYILGGLERVTAPVIEAGSKLQAICFTGAGWTEFIPAHTEATERGIAITAAPGANSQAVAELTIALMHDRVRNVAYLSGVGFGDRIRGRNFRNLTVGIIGAGNVGSKVARILNSAYGTRMVYTSRRRNLDLEYSTGAVSLPLDELLRTADIVSLHMNKTEDTAGLMNESRLGLLKDGAILINASFADAIDPHALYRELSAERISAALDVVFQHHEGSSLPDFRAISSKYLLQMGVQSGFNTEETVQIASDLATTAMINLLSTGKDTAVVNPEFVNRR